MFDHLAGALHTHSYSLRYMMQGKGGHTRTRTHYFHNQDTSQHSGNPRKSGGKLYKGLVSHTEGANSVAPLESPQARES